MTKSIKFRKYFNNQAGEKLAADIELPADGEYKTFALFAHCFTCGKNMDVVKSISRMLTAHGFGVLTFDFTGLGDSEGDFSETNISHNIQDIIDAAKFLEKNYKCPSLLIGHSLGGAAVLAAVRKLEGVQAIAVIATPFHPDHVTKLLKDDVKTIQKEGEACVDLGGREFNIKKHFLDELKQYNTTDYIKNLNKALLIMHSPQDKIVDIVNAREIFLSAMHPKSFVSLDGADHLLSDPKDASYCGHVMASWAERYIKTEPKQELKTEKDVVVVTGESYTTKILAGEHALLADEPLNLGGNDVGPTPYGLLLSALGACTSITLRMYANRKKWPLKEVRVHLHHEKMHVEDSEKNQKIDLIERDLEFEGDLDADQIARLKEIADRCPVHRTLHNEIHVKTCVKNVDC